MQREIQESAYKTQKQIECGEIIVVGVNSLQADEPTLPERLNVDPSIEQSQRARLKEFRSKRDKDQVEFELQRIASAARGEENLMTLFIEAVEAGATLGEICNCRSWRHTRRDMQLPARNLGGVPLPVDLLNHSNSLLNRSPLPTGRDVLHNKSNLQNVHPKNSS